MGSNVKLVFLAPCLALLSACLDLSPEVPDGYPALAFGDGAHAEWTHEGTDRDIVAEIGILEVAGAASVLVKGDEDNPSVLLRFPELAKGEFVTAEGNTEALIIETDEDAELWSDQQIGGSATVSIDSLDERVVAGSFSGTVCALNEDTSEVVCEEIADGKFSAVDDRDLQD